MTIKTYTASELIKMQTHQREYALGPVIPFPGLAMLYAPRGIGKTWVSMSIAYAIATGGSLFGWKAPKPRKVLICDGEMPGSDLRQRYEAISGGSQLQLPSDDYLRFAAADILPDGLPNIATREGQLGIEDALGNADVLILDNLSSLATGVKENDADAWDTMQPWLMSLRRKGKTVILIHHAGKSGAQRGTSRREDVQDTVIALHKPNGYQPSQGLRCEVHLEKARGVMGASAEPFIANLTTKADGTLAWEWGDLSNPEQHKVLELHAMGRSFRQVEEMTGISKSKVARMVRQAKSAQQAELEDLPSAGLEDTRSEETADVA